MSTVPGVPPVTVPPAAVTTATSPPFRVLFAHDQILRRSHELVREIRTALAAGPRGYEPPLLIAVIEGARPFARLIQRGLGGGLPVHEVRAKSYSGTESTGEVRIAPGAELAMARGRDVLLLEDIVDTGRTIAALREHYGAVGARSVRVASLLSKPSRRVVEVAVEHVGFEIPDEFVIGFGMDLDGRYRELADVVVYEADVERAFAPAEA